jgi:hypothetical protein
MRSQTFILIHSTTVINLISYYYACMTRVEHRWIETEWDVNGHICARLGHNKRCVNLYRRTVRPGGEGTDRTKIDGGGGAVFVQISNSYTRINKNGVHNRCYWIRAYVQVGNIHTYHISFHSHTHPRVCRVTEHCILYKRFCLFFVLRDLLLGLSTFYACLVAGQTEIECVWTVFGWWYGGCWILDDLIYPDIVFTLSTDRVQHVFVHKRYYWWIK